MNCTGSDNKDTLHVTIIPQQPLLQMKSGKTMLQFHHTKT